MMKLALFGFLLFTSSRNIFVEGFFYSPALVSSQLRPPLPLYSSTQNEEVDPTRAATVDRGDGDGEGRRGTRRRIITSQKQTIPRARPNNRRQRPGQYNRRNNNNRGNNNNNNNRRVNGQQQQQRRNNNNNNNYYYQDDPLQTLNKNLEAMVQNQSPGSVERAQELLKRIEKLHAEGYYAVAPNVKSYNKVINGYAQSSSNDGAQKALDLILTDMKSTPNTFTLNHLVWAFCKRGQPLLAKEIWNRMIMISPKLQPDTTTYNSLLYGYAQDPKYASEAENLLKEMVSLNNNNNNNNSTSTSSNEKSTDQVDVVVVKPDTISFNTVLYAWSRQPQQEAAAKHAQDILNVMESMYQAGNRNVRPNVVSYTTVITTWANCIRNSASQQRRRLNREEYKEWIMTKQYALDQIKMLMERMNTLSKQQQEQRFDLKPNAYTYSAYIQALSNANTFGASDEAFQVLQNMWKQYHEEQQQQNQQQQATTSSSKDGNDKPRPQRKRQPPCRPDVSMYNTVLSAIAKQAKEEEDVERAMQLFQELKDLSANDERFKDLAPDAYTYTSLFKVLAQVERNKDSIKWSDLAQDLLDTMEEQYDADPTSSQTVQPSIYIYNAIMNVHASSMHWEKAQRCDELIQRMVSKRDIQPDIVTYNTLFNACSSSYGAGDVKERALELGMRYMSLLCSNIPKQQQQEAVSSNNNNNRQQQQQTTTSIAQPTSTTFLFYFKMIRRLLPEQQQLQQQSTTTTTTTDNNKRNRLLQNGIIMCCKLGLMDDGILSQLQLMYNSNELKSILHIDDDNNEERNTNNQFGRRGNNNNYGGGGRNNAKQVVRARDLPRAWTQYARR